MAARGTQPPGGPAREGAAGLPSAREVEALARAHFFQCVGTYYDEPLVLARGRGSYVWDVEGRQYLDFFGGVLVVAVGHAHPEVAEAIAEQARTLIHTSTLYRNLPATELAAALARLAPGRLTRVFFTNSGTEADETAVLLAKARTGRQEVVALRHGYSGRGGLAQALTGQAPWRGVPAQVPGVVFAHSPYCYRCELGLTYPACDLKCARDIETLIQTATSGEIAAFIAEPVQGIGGFVTPPREYFQVAVEIVRRYGGLFIADEVQTGFGRTGTYWWGIQHYGVEPDVMTMAKGIASGLPVGATVASDEVAGAWRALSFSTFGGNPVSAAAALATIRVLERADAPARAAALGARLRERLAALQAKYPQIGDVRGMGLMQALELIDPASGPAKAPAPGLARRVMEAAKARGLLIGRAGLHGNVLRIAPSLLVEATEIDEAARILDEAFAAAAAAPGPR
ncbi:MAG TPA: aspartate aminotransferase family protein [Thermodesulfobacteriota bacterium]|nr:aspartate aminotransferase family protein [Thermodesulfobacteriota bacterium]